MSNTATPTKTPAGIIKAIRARYCTSSGPYAIQAREDLLAGKLSPSYIHRRLQTATDCYDSSAASGTAHGWDHVREALAALSEHIAEYKAKSPLINQVGTATGVRFEDRIEPIEITADGVSVGGKVLEGCYKWEILKEYMSGVTEVRLSLATGKLSIDLEAAPPAPGSEGKAIL